MLFFLIAIPLSIYLLIVNIWAFVQMAIDKKKATRNEWRIPEKQLFLPVIIGGSVGGLLGIYVCRHKTKHWYFPTFFWLSFVIHIIIIGVLILI